MPIGPSTCGKPGGCDLHPSTGGWFPSFYIGTTGSITDTYRPRHAKPGTWVAPLGYVSYNA